MHSSLVRIQNVFGFFTTVAFAVAAVIALSVIVTPQSPSAQLDLRNVQVVKGRPHYYSTKKEEYAHIKFDLDADLTSLFSWNTKQVFLYVVATFPPTSKRTLEIPTPHSEAIVWDAIIPASLAPWHANTYIHPGSVSNPKTARDRKSKSNKQTSKKTSSPKSKKDTVAEEPKAYPPGGSEGIVKLQNQRPKYQITTPSSKIAGLENCTLTLRYNIQPWVGALVWNTAKSGTLGSVFLPAWKELEGGRSEAFDMPELKKVEAAAGTKIKEDLGTETGGEANRGSPA